MAASLVQKTSNTSVLATVSATFPNGNPEAGNLLVAAVTANVGVGSIAISGWSTGASVAVGVAGGLVIFYKVAVGNEATVAATATLAAFMDLHIFEYSGIDNASPLDKTATTADGGAGVTSRASGTTATLTQANELAFAAVATAGSNGGGAAWTNSFTAEIATTDLITSDIVVNATTALATTGSWNTTQRAAGAIVTFFGETGDLYGIKYKVKPRVPIINWNQPITKGLVWDSAFCEGGNANRLETISKQNGVITAAVGNVDIYGQNVDFSGSASSKVAYTAVPPAAQSLTQISFEFLVNYQSTGGGGLGRIAQKTSVTPNGRWIVFSGHGASNQLSFQVTYNTTSGIWDWNSFFPGVPFGWTHGVITYDGSALANIPIAYNNGKRIAVSASIQPVGVWNADDANLYIGARNDNTRNWGGKISYFRYWNRILNDQEVKQLANNPWQIYKQF